MENELNKQTAVEWLIHNIVEDQTIKAKSMSEWINIFEKAKEMENAQKAHSFHLGIEAQRLIDKGKNEE
jgi:uncharacterized ubiquitin-like protein YukD